MAAYTKKPSYRRPHFYVAFLLSVTFLFSVYARGNVTEWMTVEAFLEQAFPETDQEAKVLWLTPNLREDIETALDRKYSGLRIRYWGDGNRTAWILEQIGKERPITAGFVVEKGQILDTHVMVYRESRGGEIRYQAFRDQFSGAELQEGKLDQHIDGITGATLSVRAMIRMGQAALILDEQSRSTDDVVVSKENAE